MLLPLPPGRADHAASVVTGGKEASTEMQCR